MSEKIENAALFRISYGLYVVTCKDSAGKDNGLVVNTVVQLTSSPLQVAVTINKQSYSHGLIKESGVMNVSCLDESAPFSLLRSGVPVKPISITSGPMIFFMARFITPPCVRWHSSTNTKISPFALKPGGSLSASSLR